MKPEAEADEVRDEPATTADVTADPRAATTPQAARVRELIGQSIGGFRITRRLGEGGMGAVYLAVHPSLGIQVAIKVLRGELSAEPDLRRRFLDEARAIAELDSRHVVTIHDFAQLPDGRGYMVMELLDGEPLSRMRARLGRLEPAQAVAVVAEVLSGLAAAHTKEIVHRDIKPANIFIVRGADGAGHVKILDFGIAKLGGDRIGLTGAGAVLGTPEYMSPEQASGNSRAVDARADLYSVGILLYELVTGAPPFRSDSWAHVLVLHQREPVPSLGGVGVAAPEFERVIRRALAKDPMARPASAEELRDALIQAVPPSTVPIPVSQSPEVEVATPAPEPPSRVTVPERPPVSRTRSRWALRGALLALVVGGLAAGFALYPTAKRPRPTVARPPASLVPRGVAATPVHDAGVSARLSPTPDGGLPESCLLDVTDELGQLHHWGGARIAEGAAEAAPGPGVVIGDSWTERDELVFSCKTILDGVPKSVLFMLPRARQLGAGKVVHDPAVLFGFQGGPPTGFQQDFYEFEEAAGSALRFDALALVPGARLAGSFDAEMHPDGDHGKHIHVRATFSFVASMTRSPGGIDL